MTPKKRTIVQIAVAFASDRDRGPVSLALCDDGSLWERSIFTLVRGEAWIRLPDVPQDGDGADVRLMRDADGCTYEVST